MLLSSVKANECVPPPNVENIDIFQDNVSICINYKKKVLLLLLLLLLF